MSPFVQSASTGIVGFETNEAGHLVFGRINAVSTTGLDTTANLYAAGCEIIESSTSIKWVNIGTAAAPVWGPSPAATRQFKQVTLTPAQVQLLFGGTNIQVLPNLSTASQAYVVTDMVLEFIGQGGTNFNGGGSSTRILYTGVAGGTVPSTGGTNVAAQISQGTSTIAGGTISKVWQAAPFATATGLTVVPGAGLYLDNTTAAYGNNGTSQIRVSVWYATITV